MITTLFSNKKISGIVYDRLSRRGGRNPQVESMTYYEEGKILSFSFEDKNKPSENFILTGFNCDYNFTEDGNFFVMLTIATGSVCLNYHIDMKKKKVCEDVTRSREFSL